MRRVAVIQSLTADDPEARPRRAAFEQGLQQAGWTIGHNVQIDYRWAGREVDDARRHATEAIGLAPDVVFASSSLIVAELKRASSTTPIVFAAVIDPVGAGLVASLARPAGNATGFTIFEYGMGGKWLELLKDVAPRTTRAAVIREPTNMAAVGQLGAIQVVAPSFNVDLRLVDVREASEIERGVATFAAEPNGALIVLTSPFATLHRDLIVGLATRLRLPAIYPYPFFVRDGGLISYGPDLIDQFRRAAGYVDRILKGEKPADLPVQAPTKYELVINLKIAKALGLEVPPMLLARADEVIE
jgi:putative ABC transport system substrate-binding protein